MSAAAGGSTVPSAAITPTTVAEVIADSRRKFDESNETASLMQRIAQINEQIAGCTTRRDIRRRNALLRENERLHREVERRRQRRTLYDTLVTDVQEARQIVRASRRDVPVETTSAAEARKAAAPERADAADAALVFEDVLLLDDGESLQDVRDNVDDVCTNCGAQMERHVQTSFLFCPNADCGHIRTYMDTSSGAPAYSSRNELAKMAPRCVTHYSTFLNMSMGKTSRNNDRDFAMQVCYYCYVEGARTAADVTRKLINKAQKHIIHQNILHNRAGPRRMRYNITPILRSQIRGDRYRIPPVYLKKMQLYFKAMLPVFEENKDKLQNARINMINFAYVSRVLCRLEGIDVFVPMFEKFQMEDNEIRHSAFMRDYIFKTLGWHWQDGVFCTVPDAKLDEYNARMATEGPKAYAAADAEDPDDAAGERL